MEGWKECLKGSTAVDSTVAQLSLLLSFVFAAAAGALLGSRCWASWTQLRPDCRIETDTETSGVGGACSEGATMQPSALTAMGARCGAEVDWLRHAIRRVLPSTCCETDTLDDGVSFDWDTAHGEQAPFQDTLDISAPDPRTLCTNALLIVALAMLVVMPLIVR